MSIKNAYQLLFVSLFSVSIFAQEDNSLTCSDGIDNDGNGLIDCMEYECQKLGIYSCATCLNDGLSFADTLLAHNLTCPENINDNVNLSIGVSDVSNVSLGEGGSITLGFTNNVLSNSGDYNEDIWIFETGMYVEETKVELLPLNETTKELLIAAGIPDDDNDGYFDFGIVEGATSSIDIDAIVPDIDQGILKFSAVQVTDVPGSTCENSLPVGFKGADIDAVCALFSLPLDCAGVTNGTAEIDDCGNCLKIDDPNFNELCKDCNGVLNGNHLLDECGACLEMNDPLFNEACMDCKGVINGTHIFDDCDECLSKDDPKFNSTCTDCMGNLNGNFVVDECGLCLLPDDPDFGISCLNVYFPNAFSPNDDGKNDLFELFSPIGTNYNVKSYQIFNRWGTKVYEARNFDLHSKGFWWDGSQKKENTSIGVFIYLVVIEDENNRTKEFKGNVTVIR